VCFLRDLTLLLSVYVCVQVKIRGFRIELGEINTMLSLHPAIEENVVLVREDRPGDRRIVSYVTLRANIVPPSVQQLRQFLADKLPNYMVPAAFVVLERIPLTPNGKIDRDALPDPHLQPVEDASTKDASFANETERSVAALWEQVLGLGAGSVSPEADFFDLGGHSLLATQLVFRLRQLLEQPQLSLSILLRNPTVRSLVAAARTTQAGSAGAPPEQAEEQVDLGAEVVLPEDVRNDPAATGAARLLPARTPSRVVFLTGGTGFLGAHLLSELLRRTSVRVACLVRARDAETGLLRLRENLAAHDLWEEEFGRRLEVVCGDLAQPHLGIADEQYERLALECDSVLHNGALVHWLKPYAQLKAANVQGTVEVLRFACRLRAKRVHYVSTTSVFDSPQFTGRSEVTEQDQPVWQGLEGGYPQSKWVAEQLVREAGRTRGLHTAIFRPGYVTGDSRTGAWIVDDVIVRLIKGCVQLGSYPSMPSTAHLDMRPVNSVAGLLVSVFAALEFGDSASAAAAGEGAMNSSAASGSSASTAVSTSAFMRGSVYHLTNDEPPSFAALFDAVATLGYKLKCVPYAEWRARLFLSLEGSPDNELAPVASLFTDSYPQSLMGPVYSLRNTEAVLGGDLSPVQSIRQLVVRYCAFFIRAGFLPAPDAAALCLLAPQVRSSLLTAEGTKRLVRRTGRSSSFKSSSSTSAATV